MKIALLNSFFLVVFSFCQSNVFGQIKLPMLTPPQRDTARKNIVVTLNRDQTLFIENQSSNLSEIDLLLGNKIDSIMAQNYTPTVVIRVDSFAYFKDVFYIMRIVKSHRGIVIANIK